jgi:hypothetical protein
MGLMFYNVNNGKKRSNTMMSEHTKWSYLNLLKHYYKRGIGQTSRFTGAKITEILVETVERRVKELGGKLPKIAKEK